MNMTISRVRQAAVVMLLPVGGCLTAPALPPESPTPAFSAISFFTGRTAGQGSLRIVLNKARNVTVHGSGHVDEDGELILDQTVAEAGRPIKHRAWRIGEPSAGVYSGSLSDAVGPVAGDAAGNRLHLRFWMKGRLRVDQRLTLRPGGREADNVMIIRKFGATVAVLHETIRKLD